MSFASNEAATVSTGPVIGVETGASAACAIPDSKTVKNTRVLSTPSRYRILPCESRENLIRACQWNLKGGSWGLDTGCDRYLVAMVAIAKP
jgi:hypothetical protein